MNTTKFSNILLDKSPKRINNITETVINTLFDINEVVRELNSVDFCQPLGYILTKALPPEGIIDNKLKLYGKKITNFLNNVTTKIDNNSNTDELVNDIEEIRLLLEDIIPDEDLKEIIPGGDGILKVIQGLNDSLVITNTILNTSQKKQLIRSFSKRLIPLSNPINLTEILLDNQVTNLNNRLGNIIKPERFRADLQKLLKYIVKIDKSISQIKSIISLVNKIIKSINVLVKITKLSVSIIKKLPIPAKYVTVGMTVTSSSKVSNMELQLDDLSKLLTSVSNYISTSVIKQIKKIRNEIFTLLIGLNQLLQNLNSCKYLEGDILINNLSSSISLLNNNITDLENLFPDIVSEDLSNSYNGYNIKIINEDTTDNNTKLFRRRVVVVNNQNIIEYEGTPTYSNKDSILIKEGQFYIDSKNEAQTLDRNNNNITDSEAEDLLIQIGMSSNTLLEASKQEEQANEFLLSQINKSPDDKKQYDLLNGGINSPNMDKVEKIKKIVKSVSLNQSNPYLIQTRLKTLSTSLINKGYTQEEVVLGIKSQYSKSYNIIIENNNITINKK